MCAGRTITYATEYSGGYRFHYQSVTGSLDEASFLELGFVPNPLAEHFVNDSTVSDENVKLLVTGFVVVDAGLSTVGGATAAVLLFLRLFGPIGFLLSVLDTFQSAAATLTRMIGVVKAPPAPSGTNMGSEASESNELALTLDAVSFSYDGRVLALNRISLTMSRGQSLCCDCRRRRQPWNMLLMQYCVSEQPWSLRTACPKPSSAIALS